MKFSEKLFTEVYIKLYSHSHLAILRKHDVLGYKVIGIWIKKLNTLWELLDTGNTSV